LCRDHRAAHAVVIDPRDPPTLARLLVTDRRVGSLASA
jgi:hypothetical protein